MEKINDLEGHMRDLSQDVVVQGQSLEKFQIVVMNSIEALRAQIEELHAVLQETKSDWALCKKTVANGMFITNAGPLIRVEVPKPKRYWGKQNAQEVDHFLWSMERYLDAINIQDDQEKVNIAIGYLEDHATA